MKQVLDIPNRLSIFLGMETRNEIINALLAAIDNERIAATDVQLALDAVQRTPQGDPAREAIKKKHLTCVSKFIAAKQATGAAAEALHKNS